MLHGCICLSSSVRNVLWLNQPKRCVLEQKLLLTAYMKSYMRNRLVPKWMTLTFCLEVVSRSRQPLRHIRHWISRKPLEIEAWFQRTINRKRHMGYQMVSDRWRHVTLKGQTRDPNTLRAQYLENRLRMMLFDNIRWSAVRSAILATAWLLVLCVICNALTWSQIHSL